MINNWDKFKVYDLTQNTSHLSPPWPTYEPLQVKFFKRLAPNGANGMLITTSNHVGTHLDGPLHFDTAGRDIASLEMDKLMGPGVVVTFPTLPPTGPSTPRKTSWTVLR